MLGACSRGLLEPGAPHVLYMYRTASGHNESQHAYVTVPCSAYLSLLHFPSLHPCRWYLLFFPTIGRCILQPSASLLRVHDPWGEEGGIEAQAITKFVAQHHTQLAGFMRVLALSSVPSETTSRSDALVWIEDTIRRNMHCLRQANHDGGDEEEVTNESAGSMCC